MSMDQLRRGAQSISQNKGGKGPQRASYYARWKPPSMSDILKKFLAAPPNEESRTQISEPIIIIPGQYVDVLARNEDGSPVTPPPIIEGKHFRAHTFPVTVSPRSGAPFRTFKDIVCSCGTDPHAPTPCLGCYQVDHGAKDSRARDQWAFNIAHLAWYHTRPYMKDGQIQYKRGTQEPIMVKNECLTYKMENVILGRAGQQPNLKRKAKQCEGCQGQHPHVWGDHRTIQVGSKHLQTILDMDDQYGRKCANCGTGIIRVAFNCGHCKQEVLDVAAAGWTNEQLDTFAKSPHQCAHCSQATVPESVFECGFDDNFQQVGGGCPDNVEPRRTSIFDCVLWMQREGDGTDTEIVVTKVELISAYKTPDGRPMADHLKEIVPAPFNLDEMYSADTLDEQAETIGVANPYATQQTQYQPYAGAPGAPMAPQPPGYGPQPGPAPQGVAQPGQPLYPGAPMPGRPNYGK